jgi:hypothetical protein
MGRAATVAGSSAARRGRLITNFGLPQATTAKARHWRLEFGEPRASGADCAESHHRGRLVFLPKVTVGIADLCRQQANKGLNFRLFLMANLGRAMPTIFRRVQLRNSLCSPRRLAPQTTDFYVQACGRSRVRKSIGICRLHAAPSIDSRFFLPSLLARKKRAPAPSRAGAGGQRSSRAGDARGR